MSPQKLCLKASGLLGLGRKLLAEGSRTAGVYYLQDASDLYGDASGKFAFWGDLDSSDTALSLRQRCIDLVMQAEMEPNR